MVRAALLAPFRTASARGNAVTVDRVARRLPGRGVDLHVWDLSNQPAELVTREVMAFRPDLIHAFHALRTGPLALTLARRLEAPLVITLTGTDANHDLVDPEHASIVRGVLEDAEVITAFHTSIVQRVVDALPACGPRCVVVPQSVDLPLTAVFDLAARWALPPDRVLFLMPAGIRPVKGPRVPLAPLDALAAADPRLRLAYVGPVLDGDEAAALERELGARPWARYLGPVPHAGMASLLGQADVVLNCSVSEGGMANSLLEALAMGRAVLASDITGNRALVVHDVTGLLFRDAPDLLRQASRLAGDPALRARLGAAGQALVEHEFPIEREVQGYWNVYRQLARVTSR
jgi:glycosyltransferase involved in cell wall biosynthesis